jgi:hypothetical protein
MNTKAIRCATFLGAALASLGWSQDVIRVAPPPPGEMQTTLDINGFPPSFKMVGMGGIEGKTVTGAPYSAEETTQTTQTLADGNRIVNTSKSKVYRDQQGRRRVEQTLGNIGGLHAAEAQATIMIDDPTANVHYTLRPDTRTAEKVETNGSGPSAKEGAVIVKQQMETAMTQLKMRTAAQQGAEIVAVAGVVGYSNKIAAEEAARTSEDLGTQNMEGVQVQGKRTTTTIPAGAMGNERPIQIVDERWYSPELQMNIMTKHSDPRMGETVFTVTGVSRANPDGSLFQLPADYQVTATRNMMYRFTKTVTNP